MDIIAAMKPVLGDMKDTVNVEITCAKIDGITRRVEQPQMNVPKEKSKAVKNLLSNEAIVITPAYIANATVLLNSSDYLLKAKNAIGK